MISKKVIETGASIGIALFVALGILLFFQNYLATDTPQVAVTTGNYYSS